MNQTQSHNHTHT